MSKVILDRETFKALASDTRLDILRFLDGKSMNLNDMCTATNLNKATLHEHLVKLYEAGLIKKNGREGHKWIYYKLTWKGECLLHPENSRIVVLFSTTIIALVIGVFQFMRYVKGTVVTLGQSVLASGNDALFDKSAESLSDAYLKTGSQLPPSIPNFINSLTNKNYFIYNSSIKLETYFSLGRLPDGDMVSVPSTTHEITYNSAGAHQAIYQDPTLLYIAIACLTIFTVVLCISVWRIWKNKKQQI